jgi:hypothetical protein
MTATEPPTGRVALDMATDLNYAGDLPAWDDPRADVVLADATSAWLAAADAAAVREGYVLDVVTNPELWSTCEPTHDEDGAETLTGRIWRAGHDAFEVVAGKVEPR